MGEQYVGIDLHRRRSVIVRMTPDGEVLETVRVDNDPVALSLDPILAGAASGLPCRMRCRAWQGRRSVGGVA